MSKSATLQAREYIYELKNCANEFGFKDEEAWEFSLVTDAEKSIIERGYYPTLSATAEPLVLLELLKLVKDNLFIPKSQHEPKLNARKLAASKINHLIAFNVKRQR
ncbi:MAG: hypothetical protein NVSMB24_28450 [Mucilaginibacter sp.]